MREKEHGPQPAADGPANLSIDVDIPKETLVAVCGPSGSGKTTLLKILAGLLKPDGGRLRVDGRTWIDIEHGIFLKPQKRPIGFVFQDYALFPNMSVRKNLEFAMDGGRDRKTLDEILEIMELGSLQARMPETLSGGQKQRVALARALARKPRLLLLDEPLAALDLEMREKIQDYLIKIHRIYALTTLVVTHDFSEIFRMADFALVLERGSMRRFGPPNEVFAEQQISGKFRFAGRILSMEKQDVVYVIRALVGNQIVKVIATTEEAKSLVPGDNVLLTSKAFNPIILPISTKKSWVKQIFP